MNRITTGGKLLGPDERITPYEALTAVTKDAAWQYLEWYHSPEVQQALIDDPRDGYASANVDLLDYQLEEPGTARWASLKSITEGWGSDVWS